MQMSMSTTVGLKRAACWTASTPVAGLGDHVDVGLTRGCREKPRRRRSAVGFHNGGRCGRVASLQTRGVLRSGTWFLEALTAARTAAVGGAYTKPRFTRQPHAKATARP